MGKAIEPAIKPLGFNWEIGFGIISSFPAREVFVSSLSTVLHVSDTDQEDHRSLIQRLQEKRADGSFSTYTAISLMVFYVFACQCMSTLAVCKRETGSWRWVFVMFGYMTTLAYIASFVTYQIGIRLF
jgi:ferrous iron transport protein B